MIRFLIFDTPKDLLSELYTMAGTGGTGSFRSPQYVVPDEGWWRDRNWLRQAGVATMQFELMGSLRANLAWGATRPKDKTAAIQAVGQTLAPVLYDMIQMRKALAAQMTEMRRVLNQVQLQGLNLAQKVNATQEAGRTTSKRIDGAEFQIKTVVEHMGGVIGQGGVGLPINSLGLMSEPRTAAPGREPAGVASTTRSQVSDPQPVQRGRSPSPAELNVRAAQAVAGGRSRSVSPQNAFAVSIEAGCQRSPSLPKAAIATAQQKALQRARVEGSIRAPPPQQYATSSATEDAFSISSRPSSPVRDLMNSPDRLGGAVSRPTPGSSSSPVIQATSSATWDAWASSHFLCMDLIQDPPPRPSTVHDPANHGLRPRQPRSTTPPIDDEEEILDGARDHHGPEREVV